MVNFDGPTHLLQYINMATEEGIYLTLALELLKHQQEIATGTITELADACFVSPATLSRFCKKLGFSNYVHFKESFMKAYEFERDYNENFLQGLQENPDTTIRSLNNEIQEALAASATTLDFAVLDDIIQRIHDSKDVAFFSSNVLLQMAADIQQRLQKLGKLTYAFSSLSFQDKHIKQMNEQSLAIFISVNGGQLYTRADQIMELKRKKVPIVLITQNPHTMLEGHATLTLLIGGKNQNNTGRYCVMYVLETLLIRYYQRFYHK